jgi:hypothetical protein
MTNQITWHKPDPPLNALHTAFAWVKAVAILSGRLAGTMPYAVTLTSGSPSAPIRMTKGSAVVAIGVDRHSVGRDDGAR